MGGGAMSNSNSKHAVILAGGKGVRLRPYTTNIPKPLVPIGDQYAVLEIVLRQLAFQGFKRATIAIGHLGTLIRAFVRDGKQFGLDVDYHEEVTPLGTIGPVIDLLDKLPDHFLLVNGDTLTDLNYAALLEHHIASGAPMTVSTFHRNVQIDFGVLEDSGGIVTHFVEKPTLYYSVCMGANAISKSALADYPKKIAFGFDQLMLDLLARGTPPATFVFDGIWFDIGRPDDYDEANSRFETLKPILLPGEVAAQR
jgi:NDP-mannose synthase